MSLYRGYSDACFPAIAAVLCFLVVVLSYRDGQRLSDDVAAPLARVRSARHAGSPAHYVQVLSVVVDQKRQQAADFGCPPG